MSSSQCHLPSMFKVVQGATPATDAAGRTSRYVSMKNVKTAFVVVHIAQGAANTVLLSVLQATTVAGANSKALANVVPIWANQDLVAADALVRQTDAVTFTTSATLKDKCVIFQVDGDRLDTANGFDCLAISTGASNASNLTEVMFYLEERYAGDPGASSPSTITD